MVLDRWLLLAHILSAAVWLGAGLVIALLSVRARQTGDELALITQMEWIGARVGGPATVTTLATGTWMVFRSGTWGFDQLWVLGGLLILFLLFLVGVGFHIPQYKRIQAAVQAEGAGSALAQNLIQRSFVATRIEVIILVVAIALMVFKPGI